MVKNMSAKQEVWIQSLGWEVEKATQSNILAWEIPWTEEPGRNWTQLSIDRQTHTHTCNI